MVSECLSKIVNVAVCLLVFLSVPPIDHIVLATGKYLDMDEVVAENMLDGLSDEIDGVQDATRRISSYYRNSPAPRMPAESVSSRRAQPLPKRLSQEDAEKMTGDWLGGLQGTGKKQTSRI